ncbi:hypothetical protein VFPPC_13739 [Pochonia chlamydosporia 170]|uniref:CCHC-type domain-containing protein n=1 Tax=Pochonia chlamydosporia 170 TaxID=1380566 RepID=A0A179FT78_METCM|nr:hypothetical protein VFPPC_13739 [Pochonia chlamydosporia 170]OAQ68825.2 hypothetical protein VFPPC_13739 [Pochonia chlamydosporia 170]
MSSTVPGQHGQSEEPKCYNCGTVGHWAVACPEPTRETPAGLATWRNLSTPNNINPKGQNSGSNKRTKGPIITKYGPPPPPPPPSYGQGVNHMPPPPTHHHHPHPPTSYPGQAPSYQPYAPPPPPPPPPATYGSNFPPPAYGYSHHPPPPHPPHPPHPAHPAHPPHTAHPPHPQYQPPPPHGAPGSHFGPPGYMPPPPTLGPPPGGHFPGNRGDGHENRPPHNQAFSRSPPQTKASPPMNAAPPQNRSGSRPNTSLAKPPSLPPKPPAGVTSHPLPPKPPKSHDQANQQHEHRNKRKNDRHNKNRDRRQSNEHHNQRHLNAVPHRDNHSNQSPDNRRASGSRKGQRQNQGNAAAKNQQPKAGSPDRQAVGFKGNHNGRRASKDHAHRRSLSDNAARNRDNGATLGKKHHTHGEGNVSNSNIETDRDNKSPPKLNNSQARSEVSDVSERRSSSDHHAASGKHSYDDETRLQERQPKRPKTETSPRVETKATKSSENEECIWDTIDVPREADRRQQTERDRTGVKRRGSTSSRASRHSSQSSQSSDLNSLEAELLGRPVKQKSPEKPSSRHRSEHRDRVKPKRRPANTNSAYR